MFKPIFSKEEEVVIKRNNQKIKIKPIIGALKQAEIIDLCLKECEEYGDIPRSMPIIKSVFDIVVLALQTDLGIPCVKEIEDNGSYNISVSLNYEDIERYENSCMIELVAPHIKNYNCVWNIVMAALEMHNFKQCFSQIGANLPTAEDITKSLNDFKSVIDSNPQFVEKVAKAKLSNDVLVTKSEEATKLKSATKKK